MEITGTILSKLGMYAIPVLILAIEVIAAIVLIEKFIVYGHMARSRKRRQAGEKEYLDTLTGKAGCADIIIRRADRTPLFASPAVEKLFHIKSDTVISDIKRFLNDLGLVSFFEKEYVNWDGVSPISCIFKFDDGEETKWYECVVERREDGEVDLLRFQDVTEMEEKIKGLEKDLIDAEELSHSKTTFLSRMSHEIRTPMNGILGHTQLALAKLSPESHAAEHLNKLMESSEHLLSLINDILDMSRIEAGKVQLENSTFDIHSFGNKLRSMFEQPIINKGVAFKMEYQDFDEEYFVGDELRLSQAVINFLSNALKFTDKGEISVTMRQMFKEKDAINLMIKVHDTGIGMSADFVNRIFRPFEQESIETSKKYGGTGLGMAITDQIIGLMGGEIVVNSLLGEGTDISVYVSLKIATEEQIAQYEKDKAKDIIHPDEAYSFKGKRILMAEDNELNAEIAIEFLNMMGAEVEIAVNGQEAVEKFAACDRGYYDFILMDIQMPIMDGREAARTIRTLHRDDAGEILIFALSADAFLEDTRMSIEAGMDGHFSKPIDFAQMEKDIGRIISEKTGR